MKPLWAGRSLALVGILLLALNLRTAVAALSPIVDQVSGDIPLDSIGLGILGMVPPVAFAVAGVVAPVVAKRLGLEAVIALACVAMVVGPLVRAAAGDFVVLTVGTAMALAGMGFGNILLPPAVKKYFPDRIGLVTSAYATLLAIGTAIPALVAFPIAAASGWRVSIGVWAILACFALVPWLALWAQHRRDVRPRADDELIAEPAPDIVARLWHSRTAVATAITFAVSALNAYAMFAWLPEMLKEIARVDSAEAGALLFLFGIIGFPFSLLIPVLAVRLSNVAPITFAGVALLVVGYLGLLFTPTVAPWLWVSLVGAGPALIFPLCLVLINVRTMTPATSVALSGFVQSIGYGLGATGPLLVGVIHTVSGGWMAPLIFLLATTLVALGTGVVLAKPQFVEEELARR